MKLKSLTLNGFKSFADKTKIEFQDGMTGIVGPNGSGKSNIIEALRWALGEQSAKSLRGGKMPDVIFAGSQTRAPLNHAEVELEFDNSDHFLDLNADQVVISRKIYRNGDSDFLINNAKVRLRDIVELFMDTGLGRESFSIISQGKVEAIFNSKPQDRRVLIEEVAGVVKYKKEKQKAQQELAETTDHLDRVADIITELRQQREPLKEQASIAKDYVAQKEEFDHYEKSRLVLEIEQRAKNKAQIEAKLSEIEKLLATHTKHAELQEQKSQQLVDKQAKLEAKLDEDQREFNLLTGQREKLIGRHDISKHDDDLFNERLAEFNENIKRDESLVAKLQAQVDELTTQQAKAASLQNKYTKQIRDIQAALVDDPETLADQVEKLRQDLIDLMQAQISTKNELAYLEQENQRNSEQKQADQKRIANAKAQLATLKEKQASASEQATEAKTAYAKVQATVLDFQTQQTTAQRLREDQQRRWLKASEILQKARAQHESLQNIAANYAGYYHGVKAILQADLTGVVGSVAQRLKVPAQVAKAIDVALGAQLQNVIVTDERSAKAAINYLTKKKAGRATFLPRTTVKPRFLAQGHLQTIQQQVGVVGLAKDLVQYDPLDKPVVEYLLGAIVIAQDLDAATKLAVKLNYSVKIVTLAGEVINAGGSMTGGQDRNQRTGLLEQQQQVEKLAADITVMEQKLSQIEFEGGQTKEKVEQLVKELETLKPSEQQALEAHQQALKNLERCELEVEHQADQVKQLEVIASMSEADQSQYESKHQALVEQQATLTKDIETKQSEIKLRVALQKDTSATQAKQQATLNELKQKEAIAKERAQLLQVQVKESQVQLEQTHARITKAQSKISEIKENQKQNQVRDTDIEAKRQAVEQRYEKLEQAITAQKQKRQDLAVRLKNAQQELKRANELRQASLDEKSDIKAQLGSFKADLARDLDELAQNYGLSYEMAKQENQATDLEFVKNKVHLLKLGIEELGEVNLGAISEFERINTRYEFLTQQQADLLEAKAQLVQSMDEMDAEAKSRFKQAFDEVAAAFSAIFPQVFEGGKAMLSLTDPADLLTTGVEIMAQPPGKKFQHLNLLSGGERALTAIVLLFAILKVRPVPFVVLDEAEAALDDANVIRYSRYLQRFNAQTQFIVITHRKGTMMNADVLYGVTMQESGVSKMVSVSLDELA